MGSGKGQTKRVNAINAKRVNELLPKPEVVAEPVSNKYLAKRVRDALGDGKINIVTLVDRSGSVWSDPQLTSEQEELVKSLEILEKDDKKINTSIWGYSGAGRDTEVFEYKDFKDEAHPELITQTGGGGTPTDEAMEHAYDVIKGKKGKNMILVITDGASSNIKKLTADVNKYRKEGIIISAAFQSGIYGSTHDTKAMDDSFGENNWRNIEPDEEIDNEIIIGDAIKAGVDATQKTLGKTIKKTKYSSNELAKAKQEIEAAKPKKFTKVRTISTTIEYLDEDGNTVTAEEAANGEVTSRLAYENDMDIMNAKTLFSSKKKD